MVFNFNGQGKSPIQEVPSLYKFPSKSVRANRHSGEGMILCAGSVNHIILLDVQYQRIISYVQSFYSLGFLGTLLDQISDIGCGVNFLGHVFLPIPKYWIIMLCRCRTLPFQNIIHGGDIQKGQQCRSSWSYFVNIFHWLLVLLSRASNLRRYQDWEDILCWISNKHFY